MKTYKHSYNQSSGSPLLWLLIPAFLGLFLYAGHDVLQEALKEKNIVKPSRKIEVLNDVKYRFRRIYYGPNLTATRTSYPAVASMASSIAPAISVGSHAGAHALPTYTRGPQPSGTSGHSYVGTWGGMTSAIHTTSSASVSSFGGGSTYASAAHGSSHSLSRSISSTATGNLSFSTNLLAFVTPRLNAASSQTSSSSDAVMGAPRRAPALPGSLLGERQQDSEGVWWVWTPSGWAPEDDDTSLETPGDPLPLGDPLWPMLLMAAIAAIYITFRRKQSSIHAN